MVLDSLNASAAKWAEYTADPARREAAWSRFKDYAYQWY